MNEHDKDLRNDLFARHHHERGDMPWGWGHHRGGFGAPRRGPSRARRGDVQIAILNLLSEQSMHGYQIIQELSDRSGGAWTPGPGSIYPTLQAMEDQDLVISEQTGSKRVYSSRRAARLSPRLVKSRPRGIRSLSRLSPCSNCVKRWAPCRWR